MRHGAVGLVAAAMLWSVATTTGAQTPAGTVDSLATETHDGPAAEPEIAVRAWADRTALWVGDRVLFTVEVACAPTVDIVVDDLAGDKLHLDGLELVDTGHERTPSDSGRVTYRFWYRLTTYETGVSSATIGDWTIRYGRRRAGQRLEEATPAGELKVPGVSLALRSTIPDDVASVNARDRRPLDAAPALIRLAWPIGLGLVLVSAAPVAVWVTSLLRRTRPRRRRRDTRAVRTHTRTALGELAPLDASSEAARREAYTRLDAILRQHLADVAGIPAHALTPAEIAEQLDGRAPALPVESVTTLLGECERARYGPSSALPPASRFREAVESAGQILAVTR